MQVHPPRKQMPNLQFVLVVLGLAKLWQLSPTHLLAGDVHDKRLRLGRRVRVNGGGRWHDAQPAAEGTGRRRHRRRRAWGRGSITDRGEARGGMVPRPAGRGQQRPCSSTAGSAQRQARRGPRGRRAVAGCLHGAQLHVID